MNRFIFSLIFLTLTLSSCASRPNKAPPPPLNDTRGGQHLEHTVKHFGETLGVIAAWYTGKGSNWIAIRDANPGIKPEKIRIGQTIKIPKELVTKEEGIPESYVRKFFGGTDSLSDSLSRKKPVEQVTPENESLINELLPDTAEPKIKSNLPTDEQPIRAISPVPSPEPAPTKDDLEREKMLDELLQ